MTTNTSAHRRATMAGVSCGGVFAAPDQEQEPSSTGGEAGAEEDWGAAMRWHTSSASSSADIFADLFRLIRPNERAAFRETLEHN
jgi:hypothetical protein